LSFPRPLALAKAGGESRIMKTKRYKIVPASYLILLKNHRILLSRRFNTGYRDGQYGLISGHLHQKESFTSAAIREAKEEANLSVQKKDLKVVHAMNRYEPKNNKAELADRIDVFFLVKKWRGKIKNLEPDKCDDLNWFPLNKLPKKTIPYIRQSIYNISKKTFYSEYGY